MHLYIFKYYSISVSHLQDGLPTKHSNMCKLFFIRYNLSEKIPAKRTPTFQYLYGRITVIIKSCTFNIPRSVRFLLITASHRKGPASVFNWSITIGAIINV